MEVGDRDGGGGHFCESSGEPHLWESRDAGWRERLGYHAPTLELQQTHRGKPEWSRNEVRR